MKDLVLSINISIFIEDGSNGFVGFLSPRLFVLERGSPSFRGELSLGSRWWILNTRVARATSLQTAPTPTKEGSETREDYDGQASEQSKNSRVWQWLWTWLGFFCGRFFWPVCPCVCRGLIFGIHCSRFQRWGIDFSWLFVARRSSHPIKIDPRAFVLVCFHQPA